MDLVRLCFVSILHILFRLRVIWRLPKLKFLDVSEVTNIEKLEAKNQGPYLLIVRPPVNLESEVS